MSSSYPMHRHYMGLAGPALQVAIGVTAGLCFLAFGYGQGDIGGLIVMKDFRTQFLSWGVSADSTSLHVANLDGATVASWNLGCFAGAILTFFLGDRLGRRGTVILGLSVEAVGKIVQGSTFTVGQYIAGRVIAGIGNGFIASTVPAWQAECLKTHRRGTLLLVSFGTCITLGVAISYWMMYAFSFLQPNSVAWRFPIVFSLFFILPALLIIIFMPESPRWLLLQAREKEAIRVLSALNEMPEDHEDIRREILQIKYAVKHMASAPPMHMFSNGEYRYLHRIVLAVLLQIMQQFTGVNLFIQYLGSMFWNQLRFPAEEAMLLAGACSTVFFVASLLAVASIDRYWTRRALTMFGATGMMVCMILLAALNKVGDDALSKHGASASPNGFYGMTAFLFLYVIFFSVGWQGMSWLWAVELVPLSIRGPANALATAANWLSNFIIVISTPTLFAVQRWRTYIVFAVFNFVFIPTIYFLYPETGGRSLEEVDMVFYAVHEKSKPWLAVVQTAKEEPRWFDRNGDPTDSFNSSSISAMESDPEMKAVSSNENSPDSYYRETRPSTALDLAEVEDSAPAPVVSRMHSSRG